MLMHTFQNDIIIQLETDTNVCVKTYTTVLYITLHPNYSTISIGNWEVKSGNRCLFDMFIKP